MDEFNMFKLLGAYDRNVGSLAVLIQGNPSKYSYCWSCNMEE